MSASSKLVALLKTAAETMGLKNYSIDPNLGIQKGDGLLGDLRKTSITDEDTKTTSYLIIKEAPVNENRRHRTCIPSAYANEIHFYTTIMPAFIRFQKEKHIKDVFNLTPKCMGSVNKIGEEMIALDDITKLGFGMMERTSEFDDAHCRFFFETYGRFHALSICFKDQKPNEYEDLIGPLHNVPKEMATRIAYTTCLKTLAERCYAIFDPVKEFGVCEAFKKYTENVMEIYLKSLDYTGNCGVILHGDSWSNNIMFKYKGSEIEQVNLLDFQFLRVGSPVDDLSYLFYSSASKELFDNLEEYLDLYHQSFSKFVHELGSDPAKLLPRLVLSEEWKTHSKLGMILALFTTQLKLMSRENATKVGDSFNEQSNGQSHILTANVDKNLFNEKARNIVLHLYKINAL